MEQVTPVNGRGRVLHWRLALCQAALVGLFSSTGCAQTPADGPVEPQATPAAKPHISAGRAVARPETPAADPRLERAALHMAQRDPRQAAAEFADHDPVTLSPEARYLLGRALLADGRYDAAARALPVSAHGIPKTLWVDVQRDRAKALVKAGECTAASSLLDTLATRDSSDVQLHVWRGQCALREKHFEEAQRALEHALAADPSGKQIDHVGVELDLADALIGGGKSEVALQRLRTLYIEAPGDHRANRIRRTMRTAARSRARFRRALRLDAAEQGKRAAALYQARDFEGAALAYRRMRPPKRRKARADYFHRYGMALFRCRTEYRRAARILAKAATLKGPHQASDAFHAARALARADKDRAAIRAFGRFLKKYPRSKWAPDAAYLRGWLGVRHNFRNASAHLESFVQSALGRRDTTLRSAGLFALAMGEYRKRHMDTAQRRFEEYAQGRGEMVAGRGFYWAGRAAATAKRRGRARKLYEDARQAEPLNYYGLLATLRLQQTGRSPKALLPTASESGPDLAPISLPSPIRFLHRLGLHADAAEALRKEEPHHLAQRRTPLSDVLPWAMRYAELGAHNRAVRLLSPHWPGLRDQPAQGRDRLAWDLLFPRPYAREVLKHCTTHEVDPDLVYSIMRKESLFEPSVVSSANAMGLMQLLPETAAKMADEAPDAFDARRLLVPAENIRFGVKYLGNLLKRYPQHPALAIAAYNAGTGQVDSWLKREKPRNPKAEFPVDEFVERIPITQTRNYVRRVLSNWARYRYLGRRAPATTWKLHL